MCRRSLAALSLFAACLAGQAWGAPPAGWPKAVAGDTGFADLGRAIQKESGFPTNGSDVEKARFVFSRMGDVTTTYGLKPGSGRTLSNDVIGLYRTFGHDAENADSLKGFFGWGNCGEWSYAFSEILGGAGVVNRVVYADKDDKKGYSDDFTGTDTTVIVEERGPDGRISRRVFDAFRAAYHSDTGVPTDETLKEWGDLPLTEDDRWQDETARTWLDILLPQKKCVKDAVEQTVLPAIPAKSRPGDAKRPQAAGGFTGTWVDPSGQSYVLTQTGDRVTGSCLGVAGALDGTVKNGTLTAKVQYKKGNLIFKGTFELTLKDVSHIVGTYTPTNSASNPVTMTRQ